MTCSVSGKPVIYIFEELLPALANVAIKPRCDARIRVALVCYSLKQALTAAGISEKVELVRSQEIDCHRSKKPEINRIVRTHWVKPC